MQVDSHGKDLNHPYRKVNEMMLSEFPDFRVDTGVHERNSDTWEFGKGALSANGFWATARQSSNAKRENPHDK
jgi:hypothetical protein